ncbi:MAG: Gx transporter family protein [Spirochaetales bacterium]|nr:Gx transporter family protein [Spirochaetales bacterium]
METRKVVHMGMLIALAMVLSFIESQIPAFVAVPGMKLGLANIAIVFALYSLGFREALGVSLIRVVLSAILFGSVVSGLYSAAGAILSLLGMALLKKSGFFGTVGVSVSGAVLHNLGQIGIACFILRTQALVYYLPFLILSAVLSGVVIGIISAVLVERLGGEEYGRRTEK